MYDIEVSALFYLADQLYAEACVVGGSKVIVFCKQKVFGGRKHRKTYVLTVWFFVVGRNNVKTACLMVVLVSLAFGCQNRTGGAS